MYRLIVCKIVILMLDLKLFFENAVYENSRFFCL
jgi:hypothetical protein